MGMRETLERKKGLSVGIAMVLIVLGVGGIVWQLMGRSNDTRNNIPNEFFTDDDGQTFFTAKATNISPFDHEGKQAVKAIVYECDGKKFVGYMERFTNEARQVMASGSPAPEVKPAPKTPPANTKMSPEAAARAAMPPQPASPDQVRDASINGREYKRPGDKEWVRSTNRGKVFEIKTIRCPAGNGTPTPVVP